MMNLTNSINPPVASTSGVLIHYFEYFPHSPNFHQKKLTGHETTHHVPKRDKRTRNNDADADAK